MHKPRNKKSISVTYFGKQLKLKPDSVERYYYHITPEDWGDKAVLHPRIDGDFRSTDEPYIPRICVCPTIAGCINAVWACYAYPKHSHVSVYKTTKPKSAIEPVDVVDSYITGEKWLLKPTTFVRVGEINEKIIYGLGKLNTVAGSSRKKDLLEQSRALRKLNKITCLLKH
jgi:hypothetical protein